MEAEGIYFLNRWGSPS